MEFLTFLFHFLIDKQPLLGQSLIRQVPKESQSLAVRMIFDKNVDNNLLRCSILLNILRFRQLLLVSHEVLLFKLYFFSIKQNTLPNKIWFLTSPSGSIDSLAQASVYRVILATEDFSRSTDRARHSSCLCLSFWMFFSAAGISFCTSRVNDAAASARFELSL